MIKMRLGGSNDPLEPFPQKPRGMHWRTYLRLRDQANAAKAEAEYLWAKSIPGHEQFLDPVPPRRQRQTGGARPPGMVLVHNHIRRTARSNTRGFRAWLQPPAANLVECDCGWRPELGAHYRVAGGFLAAER